MSKHRSLPPVGAHRASSGDATRAVAAWRRGKRRPSGTAASRKRGFSSHPRGQGIWWPAWELASDCADRRRAEVDLSGASAPASAVTLAWIRVARGEIRASHQIRLLRGPLLAVLPIGVSAIVSSPPRWRPFLQTGTGPESAVRTQGRLGDRQSPSFHAVSAYASPTRGTEWAQTQRGLYATCPRRGRRSLRCWRQERRCT